MTDEIVVIEGVDVITTGDWYQVLVDDCRAIITERVYRSRMEIIECWHELGERICTDENYQKYAKGNVGAHKKLANDIGKSIQSIYFAIQFYTKWPVLSNALEAFEEGKNISWYKITSKYLRTGSKELDAPDKIDEAELLRQKWGVESGQVWKLSKHRLYCGDCKNIQLTGDVIIADPPYGMNLDTDYSKLPSTKPEGNKTYDAVIGDDRPFDYQSIPLHCAEEFWFGADYYRKTIPDGGSWLVWDKRVEEKFDAMFGSAFELIWSKVQHKREIIRWNNTLFSGQKEAQGKLHPTAKPTKVIEWIIDRYSNRGNTIIDPFAGSGTTIIACENLGRICQAIEIEPKYVAVALERWLEATGSVACLE